SHSDRIFNFSSFENHFPAMKKLPQGKQIFLFHLSTFRGAYHLCLGFLLFVLNAACCGRG
ncbi:hypothetical protein RUW02_23490, partial [Bacillus sp. IG6]|uniref:hypothetical protein n=1 Tax=Bacillus sp. IG6 TaxID=3075934 RepID=UPI0028F7E4D2